MKRLRMHHHKQQPLSTPEALRWQRFHFYWPNGRRSGVGVTIWRHEFSVALAAMDGEATP